MGTQTYYENQRKRRLEAILRYLQDEAPMKKEKLIGVIQFDYGIQKRTAESYVETLERADKIESSERDVKGVKQGAIE